MNRLNRTFEDHSHDQYYNNIVILSCLHFYAVDESRVASSLCYLLSMIMRRVIMRYMVNALFFFPFLACGFMRGVLAGYYLWAPPISLMLLLYASGNIHLGVLLFWALAFDLTGLMGPGTATAAVI